MGDYLKAAKEGLGFVWELLRGKKTYIAAVAGLIYGFIQSDTEVIIISLGLLGLRHGIASEIARLVKK